jgi:hypothetical protein
MLTGVASPQLTITTILVARRSAGTNGSARCSTAAGDLITILGWVYLQLQVRTVPIKARTGFALFALIFDECIWRLRARVTSSPSVNTQLTVTATSGTQQTLGITLTVTH